MVSGPDYSEVKPEDLGAILHEIESILRQGAYYKRIHLGGGVWVQVSALSTEEVYDLYDAGRVYEGDDLAAELFLVSVKAVIVGRNITYPTREELVTFWTDLCGMHHDLMFFTHYQKILYIFQSLHAFVPTFCDTPNSHLMHAWYVHNACRRKYSGANSLEMLWVWLMRRYEQDVAFEHSRYVAGAWSKAAIKAKSLVTEGFSWYHQKHNKASRDPHSMSVAEMEAMMERHRRGEKDQHDLVVEATEQAQRAAILDLLERENAKAAALANLPLPDEYTTF